jgi:GNAT superfamily N-acetyltransferase
MDTMTRTTIFDQARAALAAVAGRTHPHTALQSGARPPLDAGCLNLVGTARVTRAERIDLLSAPVSRHPAVWPRYQKGLFDAYSALGAGHLAPGPELPVMLTDVVLAVTHSGEVLGGVRLRAGTELPRYDGLSCLSEAIAEREAEGVDEATGIWVHAAARGLGLGEALMRAIASVAAETGKRWTVGFANQLNLGPTERAGFARDERFVDLPFPDGRFRSTLVWFDHLHRHPWTEEIR